MHSWQLCIYDSTSNMYLSIFFLEDNIVFFVTFADPFKISISSHISRRGIRLTSLYFFIFSQQVDLLSRRCSAKKKFSWVWKSERIRKFLILAKFTLVLGQESDLWVFLHVSHLRSYRCCCNVEIHASKAHYYPGLTHKAKCLQTQSLCVRSYKKPVKSMLGAFFTGLLTLKCNEVVGKMILLFLTKLNCDVLLVFFFLDLCCARRDNCDSHWTVLILP